MKRSSYLAVVLCLVAVWLGCQKSEPAAPAAGRQDAAQSAVFGPGGEGTVVTLVKLKVPNMTCGGCASAVRSDLAKIDGVTGIETNVTSRTCSFKLTKPDVDYKTQLDELSKTNEKLAGYEVL